MFILLYRYYKHLLICIYTQNHYLPGYIFLRILILCGKIHFPKQNFKYFFKPIIYYNQQWTEHHKDTKKFLNIPIIHFWFNFRF